MGNTQKFKIKEPISGNELLLTKLLGFPHRLTTTDYPNWGRFILFFR